MGKLVSKYIWESPVRITHWVNFLSILTLSATGIYIGSPKTLALTPSQYIMGWVRFVHFVAAYAFTISVLSRIYWAFAGNEYANWRSLVPYLYKEGRRNMKETFLFYTFFKSKPPHSLGHNAMAGTAYLSVFLLYIVMIFTGFALYSEHAPHSLVRTLFGWQFSLFSNQGMRLTHHCVMWLLLVFAIQHVYSAWLMEVTEKNGVISSIFGGYKSAPTKE